MTAKGVHNNLVRNLEHWQSIALPGSVKLSDESLCFGSSNTSKSINPLPLPHDVRHLPAYNHP